MDGILSTTAAAGKIVFVDCKGILVPQLKRPQTNDQIDLRFPSFPGVARQLEIENNVADFLSKVCSEDLAKLSYYKLYREPLPALDEFGRVISFKENHEFIFNSSSLESDPSFVEISLEDSFANEEQDSFEIYSNDVSSATAAQTLANGIRTLGNKVRGFFARTFPKRFNADKI